MISREIVFFMCLNYFLFRTCIHSIRNTILKAIFFVHLSMKRWLVEKLPSWQNLKAEMQSRDRMADYGRGNGVL